MSESSELQFFRTTTGIQSVSDRFNKSRLVMTFLINMGVKEILCRLRLVLEGKASEEMSESSRLEFEEKFSANNFALSDTKDNISGSLNRRGITDLPLLRTLLALCQKLCEPNFWEVRDSFVSLAYARLAA